MRKFVLALTAMLALLTAPAPVLAQEQPALKDEVTQFFSAYRLDLLHQDRPALANRYSRKGAYFLGGGSKKLLSFAQILTVYADKWKGPLSFQWRDLSIETLGPDTALVAGQFEWGKDKDQPPRVFSYSGLLIREDGVLRIRLEDESSQCPTCGK